MYPTLSYLEQSSQVIRRYITPSCVIPILSQESVFDYMDDLIALFASIELPTIEISLRMPKALTIIEYFANAKVQGKHQVTIAAATIVDPQQISVCLSAGVDFIVSPACTQALLQQAEAMKLPLLVGAVTPSEVMALVQQGASLIKFFPAECYGGAATLKTYSSIFPRVKFVATGGLNPTNIRHYQLPNVVAIAGSWMITDSDLNTKNWQVISDKYQYALQQFAVA